MKSRAFIRKVNFWKYTLYQDEISTSYVMVIRISAVMGGDDKDYSINKLSSVDSKYVCIHKSSKSCTTNITNSGWEIFVYFSIQSFSSLKIFWPMCFLSVCVTQNQQLQALLTDISYILHNICRIFLLIRYNYKPPMVLRNVLLQICSHYKCLNKDILALFVLKM